MTNIKILGKPGGIGRAVLSFSGWPDAGRIIEHALAELTRFTPSREVARWDMDGFWHTESSRPQLQVQHGQIRRLKWPAYLFYVLDLPSSEAILLGSGPEPGCRWRAFSKRLLHFLNGWGSKEVILLGSLHDRILHDEVVISSVVQNSGSFNLARRLGCKPIEYEGPAAIHAAIMEAAQDSNMNCMSLWAHQPFYLDGPNELVIAHYLRVIARLFDVEIDVDYLLERWSHREKEIQNLVQNDLELRQMLESVKEQKHSRVPRHFAPTSKVIRLEEFLRKRDNPGENRD
jgi:hypothetical protein